MMRTIRSVGAEAAVRKYDILSALMAHALAGDKHRQRLVLRLMALITTRYNWARDELTIGQREIARLWSVDERTVKREMAKLRALGWIEVKRQGARGRVAILGLAFDRIMLATRLEWVNIGPDFVERAGGFNPAAGQRSADTPIVAAETTVVPFRRSEPTGGSFWAVASRRLMADDPALFDAWFVGLRDGGVDMQCLTLFAPSRFHATYLRTHFIDRLLSAARHIDPSINHVVLRVT